MLCAEPQHRPLFDFDCPNSHFEPGEIAWQFAVRSSDLVVDSAPQDVYIVLTRVSTISTPQVLPTRQGALYALLMGE